MLALADALLRLRWQPLVASALAGAAGSVGIGIAVDGLASEGPFALSAIGALIGVGVATFTLVGIDQVDTRMALYSRLPLSVGQAAAVRIGFAVGPILLVGAIAWVVVATVSSGEELARTVLLAALWLTLASSSRLLWGELSARYRQLRWARWVLLVAAAAAGMLVGGVVGVLLMPAPETIGYGPDGQTYTVEVSRSIASVLVGATSGAVALVIAWSTWLTVRRPSFL